MNKNFLKTVEQTVLLFDGAMGTMIYNKGVFINRCYDELNLSNPKTIREIHQEYLAAGAQVIETNTWGANFHKLNSFGFGDKVEAINLAGAQLARETAGSGAWVAGSMGPLNARLQPWGLLSEKDAREAFRLQAQALARGGVDLLILETFSDMQMMQQAIQGVRETTDLPLIASMAIDDEGKSLFGTTPEVFVPLLEKWGADVIGLNCSVGPRNMLETLEKIVKFTSKPLSVMPNAGYPQEIEGRRLYLASPDYLAEYARRFIQAGARIIGGCCGTTPGHIKAMAQSVRSIIPQQTLSIVKPKNPEIAKIQPVPPGKKSPLAQKIAAGKFITMVEVVPPRGCDPQPLLKQIFKLKDSRVDAVNVPDGPRALSRMSAQHFCLLIQKELGLETLLHYTCRDRNLLGMVSDMLGLSATGLKNLLIITGDPPKMGDFPDATAVFDIDSVGLVNLVNQLNHGLDLGGNPIGRPTDYLVGVGVNPGAIDLKIEMDRFEQKIAAGAEFAITQPVFSIDKLQIFLQKTTHLHIPIIAGVWPLISLRMAEFMNNEVPGAEVPPEIMQQFKQAPTKEEALQTGLRIAQDTIRHIRDQVQGIQVSAPLGKIDYALQILSSLKE